MADWYVFRSDGPPLGPWSTEHIADAILRGELPEETWVSVPGGSRWVRALDVPNIAQRASGIETRPQRESGFVVVGKSDYASTVMMVKEEEAELVPDDAPTERSLPPPPPSSPTPPTTRPGAGDTLESPARRRAGGS
ncbi:MAG TPA: hypothetical protein VIF62_07875 [Labilithrix sp.]